MIWPVAEISAFYTVGLALALVANEKMTSGFTISRCEILFFVISGYLVRRNS